MPAILTLAAIKVIEAAVDQLFDKAKARYLGPAAIDKRIYLGDFSAPKSLPGIFMAAAREEGAVPDKDIIAHLTRNAANYLDAYRSSTKAQVVKDVQAFLQEATAKGVATDVQTVLGGKLADTWGKVTNDVKRLIDTEASNARNMGALEGIIGVNTSQGIEDPVVYFVVVRDEHLCDECKRLHLLEDETTPKLWYLSELKHGYHKRKEPFPALGGEHPHCRCTLVTLMPGYGFDGSGMVKYISPDHDEMEEQRGLSKAEPLDKMAIRDIPPGTLTSPPAGSPEQVYDYSHLLDQRHRDRGMELKVRSRVKKDQYAPSGQSGWLGAVLTANGRTLGNVSGGLMHNDNGIEDGEPHLLHGAPGVHVGLAELHEDWRGQGLGQKLYEALYAHAMHHHGAKFVRGGYHSTLADAAHRRLSDKHGLGYVAPRQYDSSATGEYDDAFAGYHYALKNELEKGVLDPNAGYRIQHKLSGFINHYETNPAKRYYTVTTVSALAPNGEKVGEAHFDDRGDALESGHTYVHPDHRRKGIASAMYAYAEKLTGKKIRPSASRTEDGQALWAGNEQNKQFGKAEDLAKSDWPTSKYLAELARFGWVPTDRSAKHPTFTNKWFTPTRPLALKHSEMRRIGIENMENSAKDVGLIWDYDGLRANPKHPYAEHYRKQGLLEPDPNAPPTMKTWTPEGPHKHVPIDALVSTKPHLEAWQHLKFKKLLADGQHSAVPPISTMELEGQHHVLDGDEQLQAAKDLGYTHVPVRAG